MHSNGWNWTAGLLHIRRTLWPTELHSSNRYKQIRQESDLHQEFWRLLCCHCTTDLSVESVRIELTSRGFRPRVSTKSTNFPYFKQKKSHLSANWNLSAKQMAFAMISDWSVSTRCLVPKNARNGPIILYYKKENAALSQYWRNFRMWNETLCP